MIMMILGGYPFSIYTAAYQKFVHSRSWDWHEDEVIQQAPNLQYVGPKAESITLDGTIYPHYYIGGTLQMPALALYAGQGVPLLLVSGAGMVFGFFVIESISETKTTFTSLGQPQKIEFTIGLKKLGSMAQALAMLLANPASAIGVPGMSS